VHCTDRLAVFGFSVIHLDPKDSVALQTKLFLLLRTAKYQEALDLSTPSSNSNAFDFESAYALYRLQREAEAASLLDETEDTDDRGMMFLHAQIVSFSPVLAVLLNATVIVMVE
jgi:signal recognition particle subunit SRP72